MCSTKHQICFSLLWFVTITGYNFPISAVDNKALQFGTPVTNLIPTVLRVANISITCWLPANWVMGQTVRNSMQACQTDKQIAFSAEDFYFLEGTSDAGQSLNFPVASQQPILPASHLDVLIGAFADGELQSIWVPLEKCFYISWCRPAVLPRTWLNHNLKTKFVVFFIKNWSKTKLWTFYN